ncbi:MAG: acyl-CoA dehydrogenase family protein [Oligoflexia bacterium]|nr:acyl-CoA dehydrogenase family protein [Oligoflexia bacterium]
MLRLSISTCSEEFRTAFRHWLQSNQPPKANDASLSEFVRVGRAWQAQLAQGNWVGVHWPKEFGGRSLTLVEESIVQEELVRMRSPQLLGLFGLTMVGPVLIKHGSQSQKQRFLSNILSGSDIWCQGFSEPGAGSDLAAIKTKARVDEKGFYVSGQKIWTSFAHIAQYCFLLCRTSDEDEKHRGLSYLLVDMKTPGITVRPLRQISGDDEFNEVFFDEVFVPKENLVGEIGSGWKIAISTLMYERVVLTFARQLQSEVALRELLERCKPDTDQGLKRELAKELARACAIRALAYEHLLGYSAGKSPGPEGSLDKLLWSESFQSICKLALKFAGTEALRLDNPDMHRYLYSRGRTIAAGTSEIQRSIIAERVLGLPRR